jgi:concanavalin A-like lectin/glucanase superfamily protein
MKSQIALEYLFLAILVLTSIAVIVNYSSVRLTDSTNEYYVIHALNEIRNAISDVGFIGFPARKTVELVIPSSIESNNTYVKDYTVNYALYTRSGLNDVFFVSDYCVTGYLPTNQGRHLLNIVPFPNCIAMDYEDFTIVPKSIYIYLPINTNTTIELNIYNMKFTDVIVNLTSTSSLFPAIDLNPNIAGNQYFIDFGIINAGETNGTVITFLGDYAGIYYGNLTVNETIIPVVIDVSYTSPSIDYTQVSSVDVYLDDYVCFNTTVTSGTYNISNVWIELQVPQGCWASGGSCDSSCQYNDLGTTNYYLDPGCSDDCSVSGSFYVPTGSCDVDGSGDCYKMSGAVNYYTSCTQGVACNSSCSGTSTPCITCPNCTFCGCDYGVGSTINLWNESFAVNTDWATWATVNNGIDYVTDATNCIDDDNDKCMHVFDKAVATYYIYKQSSEDLSGCSNGSAWFNISHVKESGNLESTDCVFVAFSNDGGSTWSEDYDIFCNDNPASTFNQSIPDIYLTNNFSLRIGVYGFSASDEQFWIDGFDIGCFSGGEGCSGTPTNCSTYTNSSACGTCGCNWSEFAWDWTLGASTPGYSSYSSCSWETDTFNVINLTLTDTGSTCAGVADDGIYGLDYQMTSQGNYTLVAGYVNDSVGMYYTDIVNTLITVTKVCSYDEVTNSSTLFNQGTYTNTIYNSTLEAVTFSNNNLTGNYVSEIFNANTPVNWYNISWEKTILGNENETIEYVMNFSSLSSWIKFDEPLSSTIFIDYSNSGNNAICSGNSCPLMQFEGIYNTSAKFDGINDTVYIANLLGSDFTMELWIKTNNISPTGTLCEDGDGLLWPISGDEGNQVGLSVLNNKLCFWSGKPDDNLIGTTIVTDNEWHYIVITRNEALGDKKLYVDANLEITSSTNPNNLPHEDPNMTLGANLITNTFFNGSIDDIKIAVGSLNQTEIVSQYLAVVTNFNASVMSCNDALCSGETWSEEFTKSGINPNQPINQYFRYKFNFETSNEQLKPILYNVTVKNLRACE